MPAALYQERFAAGKKWNHWTSLGKFQIRRIGKKRFYFKHYALMQCECGVQRYVCIETLTIGKSKSCGGCSLTRVGELAKELKPGDTFGSLVYTGNKKMVQGKTQKLTHYEVECQACGRFKFIHLGNLLKAKSCGCVLNNDSHTKHRFEYKGKKRKVSEIAKMVGICYGTVVRRARLGLPLDKYVKRAARKDSMQAIGDFFGVTRQRVQQKLKYQGYKVVPTPDGGWKWEGPFPELIHKPDFILRKEKKLEEKRDGAYTIPIRIIK